MARLKNLTVKYISLVKSPATGKTLTLKSIEAERRETTFDLIKTDDERMVAYGIVYAPDEVDSHGDSADAETIRKAAYDFMRNQNLRNIDADHSWNPENAYVAESWIVRDGDALFPDEPSGAWAVGIQIGDPALWRRLKSGGLTGLSLAGTARAKHDATTADRIPGWFERFIRSITPGGDISMADKPDETDRIKTLVDQAVAEALKAKGKADQEPDDDGDDKITATIDEKIKSVAADLKQALDERLVKALAKGEVETDTLGETIEEAFA